MCPRYPHPPLSSNHPPITTEGNGRGERNDDVAHKEIPEKEGTRGMGAEREIERERKRERKRERRRRRKREAKHIII